MTRKIISIAALAVVLAALALSLYFQRQAPQPAQEIAFTTQEMGYRFLLKTKNPHPNESADSSGTPKSLELFHVQEGSWQKLAEFPITLADLPEADRQLLQTGIILRDAGELQRSLEDYLPNF
ncbi:MAG: hypothetical protein FWE98_01375 [Oscillospiraceae bacterium]|nr:hypothetical protein [Oscillospiraceae bacterium]